MKADQHSHEHSHAHHHHHHEISIKKIGRSFIIGIVLNVAFVLIEFALGTYYSSFALLSDAGHNLGDVFSLLIALFAFKLNQVSSNSRFTYGYKRSTILVSLVNACILMTTVGIIIYESIRKLSNPQPVDGDAIAWVAGIGVLINGFTAYLFMKDQRHDLNVRGAFLHMAADTLVSVGVVISGLLIQRTSFYQIDSIVGIIIAIAIFFSTWRLLKQSLFLTLDAVPESIQVEDVKERLLHDAPFLREIHHIHIWSISTTLVAITAHVVVSDPQNWEKDKIVLKKLLNEYGIAHATLELESGGQECIGDC